MKNRMIALVVAIVLLLFSSLFAQITFERWYDVYIFDNGRDVAQTPDGGYIITGWADFYYLDEDDIFLIKTDSLGDTLWTKTYMNTYSDLGFSVVKTLTGGYVVAGSKYSLGQGYCGLLIKTDSLGDTIWTKTYEASYFHSVSRTLDGGYILAGDANSDFYLLKADSLGDTLWTNSYGGSDREWGYSVVQTTDRGYIMTGFTASYGAGRDDVYLVKTDSLGDTLWTKTYGNGGHDFGFSVIQSTDRGYVITGSTQSLGLTYNDVLLIKTDSLGNTIWIKTYGGIRYECGYSVKQTFDGGYIITGGTDSYGAGEDDLYLIKTDSLGDTVWTKTFGGIKGEIGCSVAQTTDGGYVAVGNTYSFTEDTFDVYLIKTDSLGNVAGIKEQPGKVQETRDMRLVVQPNPFVTSAAITIEGISENQNTILSDLTIYDASGRVVKSIKMKSNTYELGANLVPGIYFLKLNGKPVGKVVKVK